MISGPQPKVTVSIAEFPILSSCGLTSFMVLDIKIFLGDDEEDDDQDD